MLVNPVKFVINSMCRCVLSACKLGVAAATNAVVVVAAAAAAATATAAAVAAAAAAAAAAADAAAADVTAAFVFASNGQDFAKRVYSNKITITPFLLSR